MKGLQSNANIGSHFEKIAQKVIHKKLDIYLEKSYTIQIGLPERDEKNHKFDLGNNNYIVECKRHTWTDGDNVPSAKLTNWNEAMYYFALTPKKYIKIFFILKDFNTKRKITLAEYYIKIYKHLIPIDVEFWEYDDSKGKVKILNI